MLKHLYIQNYALIDALTIDFSIGFTVITGETGAGKSILLGALGLLLGKRADPGVLLDQDRKCIVEGSFDVDELGLTDFFKSNDIDYSSLTILRREIIPSGRSRAFINDTPVKLDLLKNLGEQLVDIHSQHQTLMLNKLQFQLEALDAYINQGSHLQNYRKVFHEYEANGIELKQLIQAEKEARFDQDYVQFQFNELETANLSVEETDKLIEKEKFLNHAEEIIRELAASSELLSGDNRSAVINIGESLIHLGRIADYYAPAQALLKRLDPLKIELADVASEIEQTLNKLDFNPEELQEVTEQLDTVYRLQQKYRVKSVEQLIEIREDLGEKLANTTSLQEEIQALSKINNALLQKLEKQASILHNIRKEYAITFERSIAGLLRQLGMKDASFKAEVNHTERFNEYGNDQVQFLFNANIGGTPGEISKIASGGELSRLMLAIKSLVSQKSFLPTVIFDEIDAGVSGEVAAKVGNILRKMSKHHQLIAISHLPQIASKANTHLLVSKMSNEQRATTQIDILDTNGRVDEIAKMMSDEKVSQSALQTAKELLKQAE